MNEVPHVAVIQLNVAVYRRNPDGSIFPSATTGGKAQIHLIGENLEDAVLMIKEFCTKNGTFFQEITSA